MIEAETAVLVNRFFADRLVDQAGKTSTLGAVHRHGEKIGRDFPGAVPLPFLHRRAEAGRRKIPLGRRARKEMFGEDRKFSRRARA